MITQLDSDGFTLNIVEGIVGYWKDTVTFVTKDDMYIATKRGQKKIWMTIVRWQLLVHWREQYESWIRLKDLKESNPIEVAEFSKAQGIVDEPAFACWVPYTMRKRGVILSAL